MISGIINVYKEKGYTSHDVVSKLRKIFNQKKIGHTGTLDPEAEGVLPICLGKATKVVSYITDKTKEYITVVQFGAETTTQDHTGQIIKEYSYIYNEKDITDVVHSFIGEYNQIPPMYSALKHKGKRLYELARQGIEVERKSRKIFFHEIKIIEFLPPNAVRLKVTCSKGTYIRTLCYDIGHKLGYGGYMNGLLRSKSGSFNLMNSYTIDEISNYVKSEEIDQILIKPEDIFSDYKKVVCKSYATKALLNGNKILVKNLNMNSEDLNENEIIRCYTEDKMFVGLYKVIKTEENLIIKPEKILI